MYAFNYNGLEIVHPTLFVTSFFSSCVCVVGDLPALMPWKESAMTLDKTGELNKCFIREKVILFCIPYCVILRSLKLNIVQVYEKTETKLKQSLSLSFSLYLYLYTYK